MNHEIPYKLLSKSEKDFCKKHLIKTNLLFKKWEVHYGPHECHVFRAKTLGGDVNPLNKIPPTQRLAFQRDIPELLSIKKKEHSELNGRTIEQAVLEGFSALCKAKAKKWSGNFETGHNSQGITYRDYLQEAYLKILEAMYSFTRPDIELSTFFWWCLHNRFINTTNQQGFLKMTNEELELVVNYEKTKSKINKKVSFDEVVSLMGISQEDGIHLGNLLNKVLTESQLVTEQANDSENDYTGSRSDTSFQDTESIIDQTVIQEAIQKAGLTDFEKSVIEAEMQNSYHGWQLKFAAESFNPSTGKPYSRMWITMTLQNAHKKLKDVLEKEYSDLILA